MNKKQMNWLLFACLVGLAVFSLRTALLLNDLSKCYAEMLTEVVAIKDEVSEIKIEVSELDSRTNALEMMALEFEKKLESVKVKNDSGSWNYNYVMRVVAAESKGEPIEGQMAVAQCIKETSKVTGMTPEQVVKQVNPNGTRQYATPDSMSAVNDSVREACERVFIKGETVTDEPIRYFYSTVNGFVSKWHENSLEHVITIGNHKFFKAKGA